MKSTNDVIDHHLKPFAEYDLNGVLSDYAPHVVFLTQHGPGRGVDAIRPLFQVLLTEFAKPGARFSLEQQVVEGDYAYILWTAETADNGYRHGCRTRREDRGPVVHSHDHTQEVKQLPGMKVQKS
jgi:ketosteroid isomerase-like protein